MSLASMKALGRRVDRLASFVDRSVAVRIPLNDAKLDKAEVARFPFELMTLYRIERDPKTQDWVVIRLSSGPDAETGIVPPHVAEARADAAKRDAANSERLKGMNDAAARAWENER